MSVVIAVLILVLLAAVIAVISGPLLVARRAHPELSAERAELEAAREAKYREIRDAELDYRTGKLSAEDFAAVDAGLRAEGFEILRRLDVLGDRELEADARSRREAEGPAAAGPTAPDRAAAEPAGGDRAAGAPAAGEPAGAEPAERDDQH